MVTIDNRLVDRLVNDSFFGRIIADSGYKSIGIKVIDKGNVVNEVTSVYRNKKLIILKGIKNPDFVMSVDYKFLKSLNDKKLIWIRENPLKAYLKYRDKVEVPFFVKLKILAMLNEA
ncbi:MAG: hypothetical protein QW404_01870 [Candidatus Nanoarchaeia archaeon]